jgi:hypothetical protein
MFQSRVLMGFSTKFFAIFFVFISIAHATYSCTGSVSGVSVDRTGLITVASVAGMSWLALCSVSGTVNGFDSSACKAVHAELLTAQTAGKTVTIYFDDTGSCATHQPWAWTPNGVYFVTIN